MPRPAAVSDQLREIILSRGPGHAIARAAGVDPGIVSRFLRHERGLTLETLDRLAESLGLRLVEIPRAAGRPRKPAAAPARTGPRLEPTPEPETEPTGPAAGPRDAPGDASEAARG